LQTFNQAIEAVESYSPAEEWFDRRRRTAGLWLGPAVLLVLLGLPLPLPVAGHRMAAILALVFVLPVDWRARRFTLTWEQAVRIDWGIVLLYGGGLAIGGLAFSTGLADALGRGIMAWLPSQGSFVLTALFTGAAILLSEATSNTASANMIVPVAIAVAQAAGVRPIEPAVGATLGASMGFMMPISTAPNAIVYSSGFIPITAMMRYGVALDAVAFVLIVAGVTLVGPFLF
jgi:solute carrier family 13 (sodium-dependent dicarboxylate transporter), member 2/3/5